MDTATTLQLIHITSDFYKRYASSFSSTRSSPWQGWKQFAKILNSTYFNDTKITHAQVLDLAAGNMRFYDFLQENYPQISFEYTAVDNALALVPAQYEKNFLYADILQDLLMGRFDERLAEVKPADISVCFGFMHHVPGRSLRQNVIESLVSHTKPGGFIALTFWQFMKSEKLKAKALQTSARAQEKFTNLKLEEGDYFLDWQDDLEAFRYVHHFDEAEIQELTRAISARATLIASYQEDGKSHELNRYLILQKRA
ncbi:MAG: class I SAM-dependent methyltransferase [Coriobacteriia bacterium]|nr:class I SAM-dependent methyltransferase [Coriobacteriia bacterium]